MLDGKKSSMNARSVDPDSDRVRSPPRISRTGAQKKCFLALVAFLQRLFQGFPWRKVQLFQKIGTFLAIEKLLFSRSAIFCCFLLFPGELSRECRELLAPKKCKTRCFGPFVRNKAGQLSQQSLEKNKDYLCQMWCYLIWSLVVYVWF